MLDSFYTPDNLAREVVSLYKGTPNLIGDFCAGDGGLLRACEERFPKAKYFANDKSKRAYHNLLRDHSNWEVYNLDFLSDKKLQEVAHLTGVFDLLLLNPPFTCRGLTYKFTFDGLEFSASKALLFLIRSIRFLSGGGRLMAVLPIGVSISERDAKLMKYLKRAYGFRVHKRISGVSFAGKEPNVILAELCRPHMVAEYTPKETRKKTYGFLHRGSRNVVDANNLKSRKGIEFVHTTNLISGKIIGSKIRLSEAKAKMLIGPAVLVPRVGTPNVTKIVVVGEGEKYILSDCVIAILARDNISASQIQNLLAPKKFSFYRLYAGTGAKYITLSRLGEYVKKIIPSRYLRVVDSDVASNSAAKGNGNATER